MPREVVLGNTVTVRRGDLPPPPSVASAASPDPVPGEPTDSRAAAELRRTRPFLAWLGRYLATAGPTDDPLAAVAARFHQLADQLAVARAGESTAEPLDDPAALPCGCYEDAHATGGECPGDLVRVRLALELTWARDGGVVTARVVGFDEDTSEPLDVGGWALDLDWAGANRAVKKFRVARDQSHGTPE